MLDYWFSCSCWLAVCGLGWWCLFCVCVVVLDFNGCNLVLEWLVLFDCFCGVAVLQLIWAGLLVSFWFGFVDGVVWLVVYFVGLRYVGVVVVFAGALFVVWFVGISVLFNSVGMTLFDSCWVVWFYIL